MRFEWDEGKNEINLEKHDLDFEDAHLIWDGICFSHVNTRFEFGETRMVTLESLNASLSFAFGLNQNLKPCALFRFARPLLMNEPPFKTSSRTNWEKVKAKRDEEIDFSDAPEATAEDFAHATLGAPVRGPHSFRTFRTNPQTGEEIITREWSSDDLVPVTLHLDLEPAVLAWFEAQGAEADNKMRAALRIYAKAHQ